MYKIFYCITTNAVCMSKSKRAGIEIFQGTQKECADLIHKLGYKRSLRNMKAGKK